jgi:repressor LexA
MLAAGDKGKMAKAISNRQRHILEFIYEHIERHGYPPTVREIGEAVDLSSSSTVHAHLKSLEERGYIQRDAVLTRAIKVNMDRVAGMINTVSRTAHKVVEEIPGIVRLPIIGTVAAGKPILAVEDIEDYFPLPSDFISGDGFILKVRGDSMIEDGIYDGDYVVVRRQQMVSNGETAVALIDNEATVKRFYKEKDFVRLQPANAALKPIFVRDANVVGKVVGLVRRMA